MYILFDKSGREFLRYYLSELPESLKKHKYIKVDESDITEKEGYNSIVYINDNDKISIEYEKIATPTLTEIEKLKEDNELLSDTLAMLLDEVYGGDI